MGQIVEPFMPQGIVRNNKAIRSASQEGKLEAICDFKRGSQLTEKSGKKRTAKSFLY